MTFLNVQFAYNMEEISVEVSPVHPVGGPLTSTDNEVSPLSTNITISTTDGGSSHSTNRSTSTAKSSSKSRKMSRQYKREVSARQLPKSTILLIIYVFAINTCTIIALLTAVDLTTPLGGRPCSEPAPKGSKSTYSIFNICRNLIFVLIPFAGWLGDSIVGLDNAINISLFTGWLGTLLQVLSAAIQYSICGGYYVWYIIAKYVLSLASLMLMSVSTSFGYANIFSYGLDQLVVAGQSNVKAKAYVNWIVWVFFLSGNPLFVVTFLKFDNPYTAIIAGSMFSFVTFCACLCLHFNFRHWFERVHTRNHYKLIFKVVKYAWKNKYPANRSSMTYWDDDFVPTRVDFAKVSFGGPFSHEDVESVKTFARILIVLASIIPFLIASDPVVNGTFSFVPQFKNGDTALNGLANYIVWFIGDDIILLVIPILELIILPLYPKLEYFLITPFKGIGLAIILLLLSMAFLLVFNIAGRFATSEIAPCFFTWTSGDPQLGVSFWIMLIPAILAGISDMVTFLCIFEFLCSQAPSGMSGILIGVFWLFRSLCSDVSAAMTILMKHYGQLLTHRFLSCTSVFVCVFGSIALFGLVLHLRTSRWYKRRERNADLRLRAAVEKHYEQQMDNASRTQSNAIFHNHNDTVDIVTVSRTNTSIN